MKKLKAGDSIYHPCSIDIIEHSIICVMQYDGFARYHTKAVHNVGACGRVEVILTEDKGRFRFVELIGEENIPYSSGLQDFIEGEYFADKRAAELAFYDQQEKLAYRGVERLQASLKSAIERHEQVKLLVNKIKESLSENTQP